MLYLQNPEICTQQSTGQHRAGVRRIKDMLSRNLRCQQGVISVPQGTSFLLTEEAARPLQKEKEEKQQQ